MSQKGQQNEPQSTQESGSAESDVKRWTTKRRAALVLEILRGETTAAEAARKHGLTVAEVEDWKERFLSGAENTLRSKPLDEEALKNAEIKRLKQKVGELVIDMDILKEGVHASVNPAKPYLPNPLARQIFDEGGRCCPRLRSGESAACWLLPDPQSTLRAHAPHAQPLLARAIPQSALSKSR